MKKKKLSALLMCAALIQPAFAAEVLAEAPGVVRVSLELVKNTQRIWSAELSAADGLKAPIFVNTDRPYAQACTPDAKGGFTVSHGVLSTGISAEVTPTIIADAVMVSVSFQYKELEGIKTHREKGCTIEQPLTRGFNTAGQYMLKQGVPVELPASLGTEKYVLIMRTL